MREIERARPGSSNDLMLFGARPMHILYTLGCEWSNGARGGGGARDPLGGKRAASAELFTTCREPEIESNFLVLDIEPVFSYPPPRMSWKKKEPGGGK